MNASLLRGGLVHVVDVVTLPGLSGGAGIPSLTDGDRLGPDDFPLRLSLLDVNAEGDAVRTRYRVRPDAEI